MATGLWWLRGGAEQQAELTKLASNATGGQALLRQGALPRQAVVRNEGVRQAQLGVREEDQHGPAVGLLRVAYAWRCPAQRLLAKAKRMLDGPVTLPPKQAR
jgi:hypothetical protein